MWTPNTMPEGGNRVVTGQEIIDWIRRNGLEEAHIEFRNDQLYGTKYDLETETEEKLPDTIDYILYCRSKGNKEVIMEQLNWNEENGDFEDVKKTVIR